MSETFAAIIADDRNGKTEGQLAELSLGDLPDEAVLVDVAYSTLNYKDGLAVSGAGRICRTLPMVCGIDLAGTVAESADPRFAPGDRVLVNGYGLSERYWGGYAQRQRINPDFLVRVPEVFSLHDAMAIGTAGYTAMLSVLSIADHGVTPGDGPVLVTGASGGVGSIAVSLLAAQGHEVVAATGRSADNADFLTRLGAHRILEREALARPPKPLEAETWAAVVDCVGGVTLATALAQTRYDGLVTACGLAGGTDLPASVMPFILRGVTLRGTDSVMAPMARRERAWTALAELITPARLAELSQTVPLAEVPRLAGEILQGQVRGRVVVDVNA